jgi:glycosyltransferase involved in cell wall biosynthesis
MHSITVIIPTYNRSGLLVEALNSVVNQTQRADEIIVVDDGSTDNTREVVAAFGNGVIYIKQQNAGPSAARNNGMRKAKGDFVALLDSDDLWVPNRLFLQSQAVRRDPELSFLFGLEAKFSGSSDSAEVLLDESLLNELRSYKQAIPDPLALLFRDNVIPTSSVFFRRSCLATVGFLDESLNQAEDYDWWLRFAEAGFQFGFIDAVLCRRRIHGGNLVNDWINRTESTLAVLDRHATRAKCPTVMLKQRISELHYDLGSYYMRRLSFSNARRHLERASVPNGKRFILSGKRLVCGALSGVS